MDLDIKIRLAEHTDAESISQIIRRALKENNSKDYSAEVIERLCRTFAPQDVVAMMQSHMMFVALRGQQVIGTASLDGDTVRTVFVDPDMQKRGVGHHLMLTVQRAAVNAGSPVLFVPSSITAEPFYAGLGYRVLRHEFRGDEKTIVMKRSILP